MSLPAAYQAIELTGPNQIELDPAKPLPPLGPHEILLRPEACGICFSDAKLSGAFAAHPRKSRVVRVDVRAASVDLPTFDPGLTQEELLAELDAMRFYAPDDAPVTPGHEPVARIVAVGPAVTRHRAGERVLVQTDFRHLSTAGSKGSFGYNFDGALAQYAVTDERIVLDPDSGERYLIPVSDGPTAAAVALIEPWACVELAYSAPERTGLKPAGALLVVVEPGHAVAGLADLVQAARPAAVTVVGEVGEAGDGPLLAGLAARSGGPAGGGIAAGSGSGTAGGGAAPGSDTPAALGSVVPAGPFDDIVYFGADPGAIEALSDRLARGGLLNIVLGDDHVVDDVRIDVGRIHYDQTRYIGTTGASAAESYRRIPPRCELRPGEKLSVIGAAGPMGLMHTLRAVQSGVAGLTVDATDIDEARLAHLIDVVGPVARTRGAPARFANPGVEPPVVGATFVALMVAEPRLVTQAVDAAGPGAIVNLFAGFAVGTRADVDVADIADKGVYLTGTSGSRVEDMRTVLAKVEEGRLDTTVSLGAVCGMAGVAEAIAAVKHRATSGKTVVYPQLADLGYTPLADLPAVLPTVAEAMADGRWTAAAERALLAS